MSPSLRAVSTWRNDSRFGLPQGSLVAVLGPHVPELRALELLAVVARTGSLGAAAAELGISQQA
ncbi:MAG TPA: LysR family transcriptional regulator, partial [Aeromicrobium sp.]|nr:LysR family transcriptional regulator [Aeromicrobium sp.]